MLLSEVIEKVKKLPEMKVFFISNNDWQRGHKGDTKGTLFPEVNRKRGNCLPNDI